MDMLGEQCYAIKFCVRLKKNTVETILWWQEASGNEVLGVLTLKRRYKMLLDGRDSVEFELWGRNLKTMCTVIISIPSQLPSKRAIISQYESLLQN